MKTLKQLLVELTGQSSASNNQMDTNWLYPGGQRIVPKAGLFGGTWTQIEFPVANNPYGNNDSYAIKTQTVHDAGFKDMADSETEDDNQNMLKITKDTDKVKNKGLKKAINKIKHFETHDTHVQHIEKKINDMFNSKIDFDANANAVNNKFEELTTKD